MLATLPFLAQLLAAVTWACLLVVVGERLAVLLAADVFGQGSNRRAADAPPLVAEGGRPVNVWGEPAEARPAVDRSISSNRSR